jgi:DNA-binding CsgD family transcriptional regulator
MKGSRTQKPARAQIAVSRALREQLIGVIEAAYCFDVDDEAWLYGVLQGLAPVVDAKCLMAGICDYSNLGAMKVGAVSGIGVPDGFGEFFLGTLSRVTPAYFAEALGLPCRTATEVSGWHELPFIQDGSLARWGVADVLTLGGLDGSCQGPVISIFLGLEARIHPSARALFCRMGGHLATAHRLRRRLRGLGQTIDEPEAVLSSRGKVEHARGPAEERAALEALRAAALGMERARGPLRRRAESAVGLWRSMVLGRWTLVDQFEHDGKRYLLARENEPATRGPHVLTPREQQVVALLALGHSGKLIAYELGIAYSTVRVLLANAQKKLGAASREELCRAFAERQRQGS